MADDNKKISFKKVGAGIIKGQAAFWGVSKVPYLNSAVNLIANMMSDPASVFSQYKVDRKDSDKVILNRKKADKALAAISEAEKDLLATVSTLRQLINMLTTNYVTILTINNDAFSTTVGYRVTRKLLNEIDPTLRSQLSEKVYYKLKLRAVDSNLEKSYNTALVECKKIEDKLFQQVQKIAALSRDVKASNDEIENIIKDFKKRKK